MSGSSDAGGGSGKGKSGIGMASDDILSTYQALAALTPLITAAVGGGFGSGGEGSSTPSVLQKMVVQSLAHPGKPIQVSMADLMNPNLLGIQRPRSYGGSAFPAGLAAASVAPAALRGIGGLASLLGLGGQGGQGGGQQLGGDIGAVPAPVVDPSSVPQVNLGGGYTMDQFAQETPVNISPEDLRLLDMQALDAGSY